MLHSLFLRGELLCEMSELRLKVLELAASSLVFGTQAFFGESGLAQLLCVSLLFFNALVQIASGLLELLPQPSDFRAALRFREL